MQQKPETVPEVAPPPPPEIRLVKVLGSRLLRRGEERQVRLVVDHPLAVAPRVLVGSTRLRLVREVRPGEWLYAYRASGREREGDTPLLVRLDDTSFGEEVEGLHFDFSGPVLRVADATVPALAKPGEVLRASVSANEKIKGPLEAELSCTGKAMARRALATGPSGYALELAVPPGVNGRCALRVVGGADEAGNSAAPLVIAPLTVDSEPPRFTEAPRLQSQIRVGRGQPIAIRFTASEEVAAEVALVVAGQSFPLAGDATGAFRYVTTGEEPEGKAEILVQLRDSAGNAALPAKVGPLVLDFTPPRLRMSVSPKDRPIAPGETVVVTVTADEPLGPQGVRLDTGGWPFVGPTVKKDTWTWRYRAGDADIDDVQLLATATDSCGNTTPAPVTGLVRLDANAKLSAGQEAARQHRAMLQAVGMGEGEEARASEEQETKEARAAETKPELEPDPASRAVAEGTAASPAEATEPAPSAAPAPVAERAVVPSVPVAERKESVPPESVATPASQPTLAAAQTELPPIEESKSESPQVPAEPLSPPAASKPEAEAATAEAVAAAAEQAAPAPPTPKPPPPRIRVVVYELSTTNLLPSQAGLVSDSMVAEIRKLKLVGASGIREVRALLSIEEQRQMVGCEDDKGCLAAVGNILGANCLVLGDVGRVGGTTVLQVKRVSMSTGEVTHSATRRLSGGSGEELLESLGGVVEELFPEYELREGTSRGVAAETVDQWNPPPLPPWLFFTSAAVTAATFGLGGYYFYEKSRAETEYNDLVDRSSVGISASELSEPRNRAERNYQRGLTTFAVGGGLAVVTGVLYFFTDWRREEVLVVPSGGATPGAVLAWRRRF